MLGVRRQKRQHMRIVVSLFIGAAIYALFWIVSMLLGVAAMSRNEESIFMLITLWPSRLGEKIGEVVGLDSMILPLVTGWLFYSLLTYITIALKDAITEDKKRRADA
jgi:hypothetical protein